MERVRLGVLGAGNIADLNVAGYLAHPDCDVVAVCDVDGDVAAEAARRWGVPKVYTDMDAMLGDPDIDAVEVLTPTHLHHRHVLDALEAGRLDDDLTAVVERINRRTSTIARNKTQAALAKHGLHDRVRIGDQAKT